MDFLSSQNWLGITASATVIYMVITGAILINTNRQNKYTTLLNYFIEIKKDYDNIGFVKSVDYDRKHEFYNGCDALELEFAKIDKNWETFNIRKNNLTLQDFYYVVTELLRLHDKYDMLHGKDKIIIKEMVTDYYNQRMKKFIEIIFEMTKNKSGQEQQIPELIITWYYIDKCKNNNTLWITTVFYFWFEIIYY